MAEILIGLGSNMGDRQANMQLAREALTQLLDGMVSSSLYESAALLTDDAPAQWDVPFLNQVVKGDCALEPDELLAECQKIERMLGKEKQGYWAPRVIDIDILSHGQHVLESPLLTLPHPEMLFRDFVMIPLAEIAPYWSYPSGDWMGEVAIDIVAKRGFKLHEGLRVCGGGV